MDKAEVFHSDAQMLVSEQARKGYRKFIDLCRAPDGSFRLTPDADVTPYALCFAIFGLQLLNAQDELARDSQRWDELLRSAIREVRRDRARHGDLTHDKPFLQLLTFVLSALHILGTLSRDPLREEVVPLLPTELDKELGPALRGEPRSGNQAMFLAILLIHARDHLDMDTQHVIDRWVELHLAAINGNGFWGSAGGMTHLQFQNGYHQYEIFDYLSAPSVPWARAAECVAALADAEGHFAPYPGGGGCYDYDAIFMLTACEGSNRALLRRSFQSISQEQNADGGFAESQRVRPWSWDNARRAVRHLAAARGALLWERARWTLAVTRPKHNRIRTHWSRYSRRWNESNLWDSWFRMLALARIEIASDPSKARRWGFINYPGIGFHESARNDIGRP